MTDGRFETTYNLRNSTFERRPFWADTHKLPNAQEIKEAESCPYHDLRADGCFMPQAGNAGAPRGNLRAEDIVKRKDGNPFKTKVDRAKNTGCGGSLLPEDTDPLPLISPPKRNAAPWTSTGKSKSNFSTPPYISAPDIEKPKQLYEPPFHTGAANSRMGQPYPYIPEQARRQTPPRAFRLKAGTAKPTPLPPVKRLVGLASPPKNASQDQSPKKKTTFRDRQPFRDSKTLLGTFGRTHPHVPTPYTDAHAESRRGGTLFTYWAKNKREAPISVPWDSAPNAARVS